ncbi:MAG: CYTH domain-containing protein [Gemmatimonadota bacterium]|nr:MAG: CYTH domain-containing protein [Gemmatimonadota bacterium]
MTEPLSEVEAKLVIQSDSPHEIADEIASIGSLGGIALRTVEPVTVRDVYFDTPDRQLESRGLALRVRTIETGRLLTLKGREVKLGSLVQREELELDWSVDALARIHQRLAAQGIDLAAPNPQGSETDANGVMATMGLVQSQDRSTSRRRRHVVGGAGGDASVAELAIDQVTFSIGGRQVFHYEVEVELEASNDVKRVEDLIVSLRERWPTLKVWHYSKYATGEAIRVLLEQESFPHEVGPGGKLSTEFYERVESWLRQRA